MNAPHFEIRALEVAHEALGVEQRMGFTIPRELRLQGMKSFRALDQLDRERLVFLEVSDREFIETDPVQQTRAQAGPERLPRGGDDRNSQPQRVGRGRMRIPAAAVEKRVGERLPPRNGPWF